MNANALNIIFIAHDLDSTPNDYCELIYLRDNSINIVSKNKIIFYGLPRSFHSLAMTDSFYGLPRAALAMTDSLAIAENFARFKQSTRRAA